MIVLIVGIIVLIVVVVVVVVVVGGDNKKKTLSANDVFKLASVSPSLFFMLSMFYLLVKGLTVIFFGVIVKGAIDFKGYLIIKLKVSIDLVKVLFKDFVVGKGVAAKFILMVII